MAQASQDAVAAIGGSAHKQAQAEQGELRLVLTTPIILRIFAITGLDDVIPRFGSLEEALTAAASGI